jgi:formylglycine-generating enzyme required for sulfatase activity
MPAARISWEEAQGYCRQVNMRLPTEAEWEYADRGGDPSQRYGPFDEIAWYNPKPSYNQYLHSNTAHEVGQKRPNGFGLFDMLGNVEEWVADWLGDYPSGHVVDPKGPPNGTSRVCRGGSAMDGTARTTATFRIARFAKKDLPRDTAGFRCAGDE